MTFKTFQGNCKYAQHGLKDGYASEFELTCRKPECIPSGGSWGTCDEAHCPYFGQPFVSGEMIDEKTGKVLMSFTGGRIVFGE